jgi:hypothetical protein
MLMTGILHDVPTPIDLCVAQTRSTYDIRTETHIRADRFVADLARSLALPTDVTRPCFDLVQTRLPDGLRVSDPSLPVRKTLCRMRALA